MHETIKSMAQEFVKQREKRRRACAAFTALAILVSISTTYLLVQPASTMAADTTPYICGLEEHVHSAECYSDTPLCGYEDAEDAVPKGPALTEDPAEEPEVPPAEELPEAEEPADEIPAVEEPATEEPVIEEPVAEEPAVEEPATEEPTVEEPVTEEPTVEEPVTEEPTVEEPVAEGSVVEEPATEEPVVEEPVVEEPVAEEPTQEISSEPAAEQPAQEPSGSETFSGGSIEKKLVVYTNSPEEGTEEPATEEPAVEEPVGEEPTTEEPVVEEPAVEEPAVEEPEVEEPEAEEPAVEEPAVEEPAIEEPATEEPAVEEPVGEEPVTEEPATEEPVVEEPEAEEAAVEEAATEEPAVEEPVVEEKHAHEHEKTHVHTDECYLKCGKEEHIHDEDCFPEDMMAFLPEGVEIPEGYYPMPPACGEGYSVTVYAPKDALPEDAVLEAILLTEGKAYENAEQTLKAMAAKEIEVTVGGVMSEEALAEAAASAGVVVPDEEPAEKPGGEVAQEESPVPEADAEAETEVPPAEEPVADEPGVEESEEVQETESEVQRMDASLLHMTSGPEDVVSEEEPVAKPEDEVIEEPETEEPAAAEPADESQEPAVEDPVLYEEAFSYDGFVALDIHFLQNGEEIKPTKPVFVAINVNGLLPDDVDPASVAIQHHVEAKEEEKSALQETVENLIPALASEPVVESVEMVADGNDNTGVVAAEGEDAAALFAVNSFSTFTVTYNTMLLQDVIVFLADDIHPNLRDPARTTISDVSKDSNNDKYVRLTSVKKSEVTSDTIDPWVYFDLGRTVDITKYDEIVVAYKANAPCDGRHMQLFFVNDKQPGAVGTWMLNQTMTSSDEVQHTYYDLSTVNSGDHSTITGFRLDYVSDVSSWDPEYFGQVDIYAIYLLDTASASPEAREGDVTDSNVENITFKLFDYSLYINKDQNSDGSYSDNTTVAPYFTFRDSSGDNAYGYNNNKSHENTAVDKDGYTANHAKVKPVLGGDGYPVLAASAANGASLNYLFGGVSHHAVTQYSPKNTILQKEGTHYAYNSAANAVDYDPGANQFNVRPYVERNVTTAGYSKTVDGEVVSFGDFHPLNYSGGNVVGIYSNSTPYQFFRQNVNYWYGMTMEFDFQMQNNGKILVDNGDGTTSEVPMIFEFSGDDDVWVFIDDVLVLDLGGTHGTVDGSINFETGQILQYLSWDGANSTEEAKTLGTVDGKKTGTSFPTTLKQCYTTAGKDPKGGWNANNVTFANYTTHTLKFFYLERGAAVANCKLDFNMPIVPENGLRVEKQLDTQSGIGYVNRNTDYAFRLLKTKDGVDTVLTNQEYTLWDQTNTKIGTKTTAADGLFILKAGQSASFESLAVNAEETYKVQELIPQSSNQIYSKVLVNDPVNVGAVVEATASGTETIGGVTYDVYTSQPQSLVENGVAKAPTFSVINQLRVHDLVIEKEVQYLGGGTAPGDTAFDMEVTVNGARLPVGTKYTLVNADGSETPDVEMAKAGIVSLKHGQKAKFALLYNSSYEVKETMASSAGFSVRYEIDGTACTESKAAGTILNNTAVKVTNTTGPELPSTGGIGTHIYTILGTVMMLSAGVLLLDQRRRREGPSAT